MKYILAVTVVLFTAMLSSQPAPREQVGPLPDGGFLLNSGWRVAPAGKQVPLDTLPMSSVLSSDGKYLLILNGGYKPPTMSVLDVKTSEEVSRVPVADAWLGLALSPNGRLLYVGGGSRGKVFEFTFSPEGVLAPAREMEVVHEADRTFRDFIGDVALSPGGRLIYACDLFHDSIVVLNPQSGRVIDRFKTGRRPYRILFHPDGKSYFVSSWADGTVHQHDADTGRELGRIRLGSHPTDMVWRDRKSGEETADVPSKARLFVSAANTNSVYVVGISDSKEMRLVETINVSMTPRHPLGMTPSALALSTDQSRLFVVCSDANAVAVADISEARTHVLGFIPTGWYPTAARSLADGRLVVLNGRGLRSFPNPANAPDPTKRAVRLHEGGPALAHVGRLQTGTASFISPISDEQLEQYTKAVLANSPYTDRKLDNVGEGVFVSRPNRPSPIQHVIYIVKENRTYDQVLGDLGKGNGDPSLALFPEAVSPNHHKLASEFVLFDNFYVNADVSADGHNWSLGAIASDYVQKMWPNSYGGRRKHYDYEGSEPTALPGAGYLWTNALAAGIPIRNYGYFATNKKIGEVKDGVQLDSVRDPALQPVTSFHYRGFDLDYPDVERAKIFIRELATYESTGNLPRLIFMRLGNDHTSGLTAGKIAPLSAMADNDYALGMIVEAVSKSKFWPNTAIFVLEDDAQNGPDHVDSHRSPAFIISPYTHNGSIDSSMYNTTSVLRTMELLLGLRPMTHFDAGARSMFAAFQQQPRSGSYSAISPRIRLDDRNPAAATAARSQALDFSEADRADDDELNDILWRAIRKTEPPTPVRSYFSGR